MAFKLWRPENTDRTVPKRGTMSLAQKMGDKWLIFRSLQSSTHCNGFLTYLPASAIALGATTLWSPWSFRNKTSVITPIFSRWNRGRHSSQSMIPGFSLFSVGCGTGLLQLPDLLSFPSLCKIPKAAGVYPWGLLFLPWESLSFHYHFFFLRFFYQEFSINLFSFYIDIPNPTPSLPPALHFCLAYLHTLLKKG